MRLVANARMYSVTPEAADVWGELFAWLERESGVPLERVPHAAPAPMAALWARPDLGCAFMCGRPWTRANPRPAPLAAPVPSPDAYRGRPIYWTALAVRADSPFRTLEDSFGARVGFTIEESQSGFNALRRHLLPFRTPERPALYADSVGPLLTPRGVVDALLAGRIDVGPLDSYALDLMLARPDDPAHRLRVVARTEPAPIPFLVASPGVPEAATGPLRDALLAAGKTPALRPVLGRLRLAGFAPVETEAYAVLERWDAEALRAGYSHPR